MSEKKDNDVSKIIDLSRFLLLLDEKDTLLLENFLGYVREKYDKEISKKKPDIAGTDEIKVPVSIFSAELSSFQSIVKYLKENLGLSIKEISGRLGRSPQTIHLTYRNAVARQKELFVPKPSEHDIPLSSLAEERSILASVIFYLKDACGLNYHEIGLLLKRDERTVWTVYDRQKKALAGAGTWQDKEKAGKGKTIRAREDPASTEPELARLKDMIDYLESRYDQQAAKEDIRIPAGIFSEKISSFQSIVKYLKENLGLSIQDISQRLGRSVQTIHLTYRNATQRQPARMMPQISEHDIPLSSLARSRSILASVIIYLKDIKELNYHEIGLLLKRDERTVWTVYNRQKKKKEDKEGKEGKEGKGDKKAGSQDHVRPRIHGGGVK